MQRAAIFASGMPVALETNGTVRDARGFTSSTIHRFALYRELHIHQPDHVEALWPSPQSGGAIRPAMRWTG